MSKDIDVQYCNRGLQTVVKSLGTRKIEKASRMLFNSMAANEMIEEVIAPASTQTLCRKISYFTGKIGKQAASDLTVEWPATNVEGLMHQL